jgi:hypothetical protein
MLIALCAGRATSSSTCAVRSIQTCAWPSMQNRSRTVHPANAGEFVAHRQTRAKSSCPKSSRPCSMVAMLFVREYICKPLSAVWDCELVPYYAPRGWRIECASKSAWEKKYKGKTKQLQKTEIVLHKLSTKSLVIKIDTERSLVHIIRNFSVFREKKFWWLQTTLFVWTLIKNKKLRNTLEFVFGPSLKGQVACARNFFSEQVTCRSQDSIP